MRPGVWRRAGLAGEFSGLDYGAAFLLMPRGLSRESFGHHLMCAEDGLMQAAAEAARERRDHDD